MILLCTLVSGGGYILYRQYYQSSPQPPVVITFQEQGATPARAGGGPVTDPHGVTLQVPSGALDAATSAQLTALQAGGELARALESVYQVDTPFYAVTASGPNDGMGRAEVSFPAASPDSHLLVVIDQVYPAVLGVVPQNGKLTVKVPLGPSQQNGPTSGSSLVAGGSIRYAVITPRPKTSPSSAAPVSLKLPQPAFPQLRAIPDCGLDISWRLLRLNLCRSNPSGTVQVLYAPGQGLTLAEIDRVAQEVEARMKSYADLGFTGAFLTDASPLEVVITDSGSPEYKPANEVIYLPLDVAGHGWPKRAAALA